MAAPDPPVWLPEWLDPADVTAWLRLNAGSMTVAEAGEVARVCAMTETYVARCRPEWTVEATDATPAGYVPDAETYQGAVMYAARELRRRNSPAGVETFADGGASFVAKFDADIERALRTGMWSRPGWGDAVVIATRDAMQEVADTLTAAGVPAAIDPRDLNPPCAWVQRVHTALDTLACVTLRVRIVLVSPDTGTLAALEHLDQMLTAATAVWPPNTGTPATDRTVLLTDSATAYPATAYDVDLQLI